KLSLEPDTKPPHQVDHAVVLVKLDIVLEDRLRGEAWIGDLLQPVPKAGHVFQVDQADADEMVDVRQIGEKLVEQVTIERLLSGEGRVDGFGLHRLRKLLPRMIQYG